MSNTGAWTESLTVTVSAVTKYYYHGGTRVALRQGDVVYYLHSDHLGSSSLTTDQAQAVVAQTRYRPYGEERWTAGGAVSDYTFTGQRVERGFGLMDYNARYYDPYLGRFISADTLVPGYANPQALNRYAYTLGNPLRYTDPTGHYIFEEDPDDPYIMYDESAELGTLVRASSPEAVGLGWTEESGTLAGNENESNELQIWDVIIMNMLDPFFPPAGTAGFGLTGSAGAGLDLVGSISVGHADAQGNVVLGALTLGGGGNTTPNADLGLFYMLTNASHVDQLGGKCVNVGVAVGEALGGGIDYVGGHDSRTDQPIHGVSVSAGVGARVPLPVEVHANVSNTWLSPIQFNPYDVLDIPRPDQRRH